jgi:hypothetical protein
MPNYLLLIHSDAKRWADATEAEQGAIHGEYMSYTQELMDAGIIRGGDPLEGSAEAKIVSQGGVVTDGPFADAAEHLGGYYAIEVPTIDEAVTWAAKLPGVKRGIDRIEVRQVRVLPDMPTA